jgi:hypothetical protein
VKESGKDGGVQEARPVRKEGASMRRTSVVLVVVAAMVTVLVFAAPAFAVNLGASDPAGPGGIDPKTGEDRRIVPIAEKSDPKAPPGTTGGLVTDYIQFEQTVGGAPPGHHLIDVFGVTPPEVLDLCTSASPPPQCSVIF